MVNKPGNFPAYMLSPAVPGKWIIYKFVQRIRIFNVDSITYCMLSNESKHFHRNLMNSVPPSRLSHFQSYYQLNVDYANEN